MISPALIRYRARKNERTFLVNELRKRRDMLEELMRDFDDEKSPESRPRLHRYLKECSRCIQLLERLPNIEPPKRRQRRKATVLRMVKGTSSP